MPYEQCLEHDVEQEVSNVMNYGMKSECISL